MIIGITGKKGSGKDTLASLIPNYKRIAFADALKEAAACIFGLTEKEMNDRELKEKPLDWWPEESPRSILQKLGTDACRNVWADVWIDAWRRRAAGFENVVVTDVRFLNEAQAIRSMGGIIVKVVRETPEAKDSHPSETEMDLIAFDHCIYNDGEPQDMLTKLIESVKVF